MLNYSLDVSTSSLIAICTISCLYKLFVQVDHDPTITSCLYERESVTYRLAHLHLNRNQVTTPMLYIQRSHENKMFACDVLMKTNVRMRCSHESWEQVVLMRVIVQNTRIKCLQLWEGLRELRVCVCERISCVYCVREITPTSATPAVLTASTTTRATSAFKFKWADGVFFSRYALIASSAVPLTVTFIPGECSSPRIMWKSCQLKM